MSGYDKTAKQRVQRSREKFKVLGFVRLPERYVHPGDKEKILKYIERLNKKRAT